MLTTGIGQTIILLLELLGIIHLVQERVFPMLHRSQYGRYKRKESVEDDERSERCQITLVVTADIIPDHIPGPEKEVRKGALGVIVKERDAVKSALVEVSLTFTGSLHRLFPGQVTQFLPYPECPPAGFQRVFCHILCLYPAHLRRLQR